MGRPLGAMPHPRVQWAMTRAEAAVRLARLRREFDPDQPRDDDGKWTSGGGGGGDGGGGTTSSSEKPSSSSGGGKKGKADVADFAKDEVLLDSETRTNPDKQKKFIETWNAHVGEAPAEFKKDFMGGMPGTMSIQYHDDKNAMTISGNLHDDAGHNIGNYTRDIDLAKNKAESSYFKLNSGQTGKAVGKQMLAANVAMYQQMGLDRVDVHANIDVGGYAWAKYGYVPNANSWRDLSDEIDSTINRMSSGGGDYGGASSWEEMSQGQQDQIERAFYNSTNPEFYDSEVDSWRDSGQPLDAAKEEIAQDFERRNDWADHAIDGYRKTLDEQGKAAIPFSNEQLLDAISVEYSGDGEGGGDFEVTFDDDKLQQPQGLDPNQPTLPGIEEVTPHEQLTEGMRDGLTRAIEKAFDNEASEKSVDIAAPDYLEESARESQKDYWDQLDDDEKYKWAERNEPELVAGSEAIGTGEISDEEARALRALTASRDPKAVWAIADSAHGKELLLGTDWYGALDLKDKETMDRFNAYVGKTSKTA